MCCISGNQAQVLFYSSSLFISVISLICFIFFCSLFVHRFLMKQAGKAVVGEDVAQSVSYLRTQSPPQPALVFRTVSDCCNLDKLVILYQRMAYRFVHLLLRHHTALKIIHICKFLISRVQTTYFQ